MLLINTEVSQRIKIGKNRFLEVIQINQDDYLVSWVILDQDNKLLRKWNKRKVGDSVQIMEQVSITPTRIFQGRKVFVSLGFSAPRSIEIKGTWYNKKGRLSGNAIGRLTREECIIESEKKNATDLERALGRMLRACINKRG